MSKVTNLKIFKNSKRNKKILNDLESINNILNLSLRALSQYKIYTSVLNCVRHIEDNKITVNMYIKKIKDEVEKSKE